MCAGLEKSRRERETMKAKKIFQRRRLVRLFAACRSGRRTRRWPLHQPQLLFHFSSSSMLSSPAPCSTSKVYDFLATIVQRSLFFCIKPRRIVSCSTEKRSLRAERKKLSKTKENRGKLTYRMSIMA